jgi:hypothetical protein
MECWNFGMMSFKKPIFQHFTLPSFQTAHQENDRKKYRDSNKL